MFHVSRNSRCACPTAFAGIRGAEVGEIHCGRRASPIQHSGLTDCLLPKRIQLRGEALALARE